MNRRGALAALAGVAVLPLLAGCGEEEDCDAEDLRNREDDCGYYDQNGTWISYPWIVPGKGGKPPKGQKAKPPAGVKPNPPKNVAPPRNNPRPPARPR